jgi:hypothetical protein
MWQKCVITFACNVVGVWIVKLVEEKMRKDKLWKIEVTVKQRDKVKLVEELVKKDIPFSMIRTVNAEYSKIEAYAATQKESREIKEIIEQLETAKYFVTESKAL